MLTFEHVIHLGDLHPGNTHVMSRNDLWQALVFRARHPDYFTPGLACVLQEVDDLHFVRILTAGDVEFRDEVKLHPTHEIHSVIDGRTQPIHAECVITLEEPAPGIFAVRFRYLRDSIAGHEGLDADGYMKLAYLQNDREAMAQIGLMLGEGWSKPNG